MIRVWSKRKLTLIGRVTVIKSLMLSKFAYQFLVLPNPPGVLLKSLESMFFKFLWNKGPGRISRKQMVKNIEAGGLRMIEINVFVTPLEETWLRRIILNSENDNWSILSNINFGKLFCLGDCYFKSILRNLNNPFWKDTIGSLYKFYLAFKIEEIDDILCSPVWCNSNVSEDEIFYFTKTGLKKE